MQSFLGLCPTPSDPLPGLLVLVAVGQVWRLSQRGPGGRRGARLSPDPFGVSWQAQSIPPQQPWGAAQAPGCRVLPRQQPTDWSKRLSEQFLPLLEQLWLP